MFPTRIVCLTEETTETLYLLGEGDRVVGVSGYTVRPPEARQKPRVSSFLHARFDKIEALRPDLVLAFSDLQADITGELIKRGYPVFTFNQRSVDEILQMIRVLGGIVGRPDKGNALAEELARGLDRIRDSATQLPRRPRVYFEEWDDPLISGICWVDQLVEVAGGVPVFPELRRGRLAKDRIVTSEQVIAAAPDGHANWLPGALAGVVGVELDWTCARDRCTIAISDEPRVRIRASGYPRPIPGVPKEQNVKGQSFAVANATGLLALATEGARVPSIAEVVASLSPLSLRLPR